MKNQKLKIRQYNANFKYQDKKKSSVTAIYGKADEQRQQSKHGSQDLKWGNIVESLPAISLCNYLL